MAYSLWRRVGIGVAVLAAVPAAILSFQALLRLDGNFHEVVPGELYRSAQLSSAALAAEIEKYRIRTVLNLRGPQPENQWYQDEKAIAQSLGAKVVDFPMSSDEHVTVEKAKALVALLKDAPKPILVHCRTGADRTGLVSMIYASQVAGIDEEQAERQLTPLFGHFGIPFISPTFAMDESWEELEPVFGITGS